MENALAGSLGLCVPLPSVTTLAKSAASHFQSGLSIGFLRTGEPTWAQGVPPKFDNKKSTLKGHRHAWGMFASPSELTLGGEERQMDSPS